MSVVVSRGEVRRVQSSPLASLRETVTDISRQVEDKFWINLSHDAMTQAGIDEKTEDRKELIKRARTYRRRNPLAKQAFALMKHYTLGQGITLRPNNKNQIAKVVDEFWEDPNNQQVFTSHKSMTDALDAIWTDGDLFLLLFPDVTLGTLKLGYLDAMLVDDIVTDPGNSRSPLWYKVRRPKGRYDFKNGVLDSGDATDEVLWYRDWQNDLPVGKEAPAKVEDGLVFHVNAEGRGKFGDSALMAALDWMKAHREFMEDRATLNRAAASIAWKKTTKTNAAGVKADIAKIQSSLAKTLQGWESNPPGASGQTYVQNEGSNMEWQKTDTGGGSADTDERKIRMMAGASVGVMNHYFGDEGQANLATATAMELPMLKMYEGYQKLLTGVIGDLIDFALQVAHEAGRIAERDNVSKYSAKDEEQKAIASDAETPPPAPSKPVTKESYGDVVKVVRRSYVATREADRIASRVLTRIESAKSQRDRALFEVKLIEDANVSNYLVPMPTRTPQATIDMEFDTTGVVDWYVDIDFPPIVQKDVGNYLYSLRSFFELMPVENIESQKLVVSMALTALGVNDVDKVMDKIFAELPLVAMDDVLGLVDDKVKQNEDRAKAEAAVKSGSIASQEASYPPRMKKVLRVLREAEHAIRTAP